MNNRTVNVLLFILLLGLFVSGIYVLSARKDRKTTVVDKSEELAPGDNFALEQRKNLVELEDRKIDILRPQDVAGKSQRRETRQINSALQQIRRSNQQMRAPK